MPFQRTATAPCANAKVTVVFSGLALFRPGADNTCEVGIHRFSTNHQTQVLLMINKPNKPPMVLPLLKGPLTADFSIGLQIGGIPLANDFTAFAPTAEPFERSDEGNDKRDYRWLVNFKEHHPNVNLNIGAQPFVRLKTGVLFTPHLTRSELAPQLERPNEETGRLDIVELHRIAASMAVAINPTGDAKVLLSWNDLGEKFERALPRDTDAEEPHTTYTVFVINDPPGLSTETHSEMLLYYKVLEDQITSKTLNEEQQFTLKYVTNQQRTDEIPCLEGRLEP